MYISLTIAAQLNMKVRDQIIDFSESFRHSFQRMTQMEKEAQQHLSEVSQDEDNVSQLFLSC